MKHVIMLTLIGLIFLAGFWFGARLFGRTPAQGARLFIWAWLGASLLNAVVGVVKVGVPVINEIGALIPIFGIPAALAWYLMYRSDAPRA